MIEIEATTSQTDARKIMGKNFFGIEEAVTHFGVDVTGRELALLADVPFSEEKLKACSDTRVLVACFPLSIIDIRDIARKVERVDRPLLSMQAWYERQKFALEKGEIGWQLVRKVPIVGLKDEEAPKARVLVYTIVGHYLMTGERLLKTNYIRCADLDSMECRIFVGRFDATGLHIRYRSEISANCHSVLSS